MDSLSFPIMFQTITVVYPDGGAMRGFGDDEEVVASVALETEAEVSTVITSASI